MIIQITTYAANAVTVIVNKHIYYRVCKLSHGIVRGQPECRAEGKSEAAAEDRIKNIYSFYLKFKWKLQVYLGYFWELRIDLNRLKW